MTVVFGRYHFSCVFEDNAALPEYKGSTFRGVLGHALKNAMIPVVTVTGTGLAEMLGGAIVVERLFSLPGIGRLGIEAILNRDFPLIRGQVLFLALVFLITNLLVDLSYPVFDPRVKYDGWWKRE